MTLLLVAEAVESGAVSPDDPVTASRRAASMGGSQVWLEEGEVMTVAEMTKCVAVVSANDCAVALAEALCGSEEAFVARMNRRAEELGLSDTHFTNCTGLFEDAEHYTCAYDIAVMSRELLKHEFVRQYTTLWQDTIRSGEFGLTNTNKLVRHYAGCTGLKTGFTSMAMYCLAASAERGGVEYIAVILHGETSQLRFDAARTLLDYAFANYTLVMPETGAPDVPVSLGKAASVRAVCESSGTVLIEKARQKELSAVYELPEKVDAPVAAGQLLGTLRYVAGNETIASVPISAAESVDVNRLREQLRGLLEEYADLSRRTMETAHALIRARETHMAAGASLPNYEIVVPGNSPLIGRSIGDLRFWQRTGGTIVAIRRKQRVIVSPGPYLELYAGDVIVLVGNEAAILAAQQLVEEKGDEVQK